MTLVELLFGLSALILGLALTHLAAAFSKLLLARQRVHWAPEPLLQACIVLLVVVYVWLEQWGGRGQTLVIYWHVLLGVLKLLSLYVAASLCLPDATAAQGDIDLHAHYDRTRRLSFGALLVGMFLFNLHELVGATTIHLSSWVLSTLPTYIPYAVLMFVRWRWVNVLVLVFVLLAFGSQIMTYQLKE